MSNAPVTAEDLYLYAMDVLDPAEQKRIQDLLPKSPEARTELANVRGDLAMFAFGAEPQEVPASARHRFLKQIAREAKSVPVMEFMQVPLPHVDGVIDAATSSPMMEAADVETDTYTPADVSPQLPFRSYVEEPEPRRGFFSMFLPWAGWAVAAGMAVSTWNYYQRTVALSDRVAFANNNAARAMDTSARAQAVLETLRSGSSQRVVLVAATAKPVPSARVSYLAANGSLVFQGSDMEPLPANKTYELWLIPTGAGAKSIPAGTFKPDARGFASLILPDLPKGTVAAAFGITMEDEGGSPTPTLPILMVGTA